MAIASFSEISLGLFFNNRWIFIASIAISSIADSGTLTSFSEEGIPHSLFSSLIFSTPAFAISVSSAVLSQPRAIATYAYFFGEAGILYSIT